MVEFKRLFWAGLLIFSVVWSGAALARSGGALPDDVVPVGASAPARLSVGVLPQLASGPISMAHLIDADHRAAADAARAAGLGAEEQLLTDRSGRINSRAVDLMAPRTGDAEWRCLAQAIYFEARGESLAGQLAVGEVVMNRVDNRFYPDSICGVVRQGEKLRNRCQFSFMCDGEPERVANRDAFELAGKLAWLLQHGRPRVLSDDATHYHAKYLGRPGWTRGLTRTVKIGGHVFYRMEAGRRVASN